MHEAGMLFSTFRPHMKEGAKKTFIQHTISRKEIVVYDMKTFGDCKPLSSSLRLTLPSLQRAAQVVKEFVIPDPIPDSHNIEEELERRAGARGRGAGRGTSKGCRGDRGGGATGRGAGPGCGAGCRTTSDAAGGSTAVGEGGADAGGGATDAGGGAAEAIARQPRTMILGSNVMPAVVLTKPEIRDTLHRDRVATTSSTKTCFFVKLVAFEGEFKVGIAERCNSGEPFDVREHSTCALQWWQPLGWTLHKHYWNKQRQTFEPTAVRKRVQGEVRTWGRWSVSRDVPLEAFLPLHVSWTKSTRCSTGMRTLTDTCLAQLRAYCKGHNLWQEKPARGQKRRKSGESSSGEDEELLGEESESGEGEEDSVHGDSAPDSMTSSDSENEGKGSQSEREAIGGGVEEGGRQEEGDVVEGAEEMAKSNAVVAALVRTSNEVENERPKRDAGRKPPERLGQYK